MLQEGDFQVALQLQRVESGDSLEADRTTSSQEASFREEWRQGRLRVVGPDLDGVRTSLKIILKHLPHGDATAAVLPSEVEIFINEQKNASNPLLWPGTHLSMDGLTFAAAPPPVASDTSERTMDIEVRFYRIIELHEAQTPDGHQVLYETKRMRDPEVIMKMTYCGDTSTDILAGSTSDPSSSQSPSSTAAAFPAASQLTPSPAFPLSAPDSDPTSSYPLSSQSLTALTPPTPLTVPPSAYLPSSSASSSDGGDYSLGSLPEIFSTQPTENHSSNEIPMEVVVADTASEPDRKRKRPEEDRKALPTSPNDLQVERKRRQEDGAAALVTLESAFPQDASLLISLSRPLFLYLLSFLDHSTGYLDLLALSRSCKQLYHIILISPASSLIWSALHSYDFSSVGKNATKAHIADILFRCRGYHEDSNSQTRELLRSSKLLMGLDQRGRVRSLNLSYCARLSLVDMKRLVAMCAPPAASLDNTTDHHTPPKPENSEEDPIAIQHLETLRLMDLDAIRNVAFLHDLYHKTAPYLKVLEVKNCSGLDSSRGVPFFDATSPRPSPYPSPAPSPMPGTGDRFISSGKRVASGHPGPSSLGQATHQSAGRGKRPGAATSTPTFVVTPSRQSNPGNLAQRGTAPRSSTTSSPRALFSTPPNGPSNRFSHPSGNGLLGLPDGHNRQSISAPTSPYTTPPRQPNLLTPLRGSSRAQSAPTSPGHSPYGSPVGSPSAYGALAQLPHSQNLRELSLLKCAPPEYCVIQLVSALPNLESLDLWGCKITDRTVEIMAVHCSKLQKLSLAENPISDRALSVINPSSFPDLISLNLRRCTELSSAAIATMATTWLTSTATDHEDYDDYFKQETYAGEAHQTDSLPLPAMVAPPRHRSATKKRSMESLDLWGVPIFDHALVSIATSFPHLQSLWLGETSITDEGLLALAQGCTELQEISLRRCSNGVTDTGIISLLHANPSLSKIDLWGVRRVSDAVIEVIAQRHPNVKSLELAEAVITDAGLSVLAQHCRALEELSLRRCLSITDSGIMAIAQGCNAIQTLDLWESGSITDLGLEAIATYMHDLHSLEITEASITSRSLVALASQCNRLTHLALRRCHLIDDAAIAAFIAALPADLRRKRLRTLDISYCPLLTSATLDSLASLPAQLPHTIELYDCPQIGKPEIERFLANIPAGRTEVEYHDYKQASIKDIRALCDSFECAATCSTTYFKVVCTLKHIKTSGMWYHGCPWPKCNKKVEEYYGPEEGEEQNHQKRWFCKACNRVYLQYVNRYMPSMLIIDHTGDLWLRAFDEAAAPLLGISAQELSQMQSLDYTLFEDKVKEAQLQQYEMRLKVVQETYQGRRSGRPYLLSHTPFASIASSASGALAKRIDAYLMLDFLYACAGDD